MSKPRTTDREIVIAVKNLKKTFRIGFFRKRIEAVREASFEVHDNEIFGIVGPNGAGKTTTIKMILGLIAPDEGTGHILGNDIRVASSRMNVSFLPEHPHFQDYLKPGELMDYFGDLYGLERHEKRKRIPGLLERVGLGNALNKPIRKFSKGMLQRLGIAQALLPDARVVILDEPQSGLDPIGRKDVRDIILELRERGKTVLFSSHILPDVEQICDRVAIITEGYVSKVGRLDELVDSSTRETEIRITVTEEQAQRIAQSFTRFTVRPDGTASVILAPTESTDEALLSLIGNGAKVTAVEPHRQALEDIFMQETAQAESRRRIVA